MNRFKNKIKKCPLCGSKLIGRLSSRSYFCLDCNHEIFIKKSILKVFHIYPNGKTELIKSLKYCS